MTDQTPKRVLYPPMWLVLGVIAIFLIDHYVPGPRFTSEAWQMVGSGVMFLGLLLLVWAGGLFKKSETDLVPFKNVTTLVNTGVYRYTRNPMYLGMTMLLIGCAVTVGSYAALFVAPIFMVVIQFRFILPEERMLRGLFGEDYMAYCKSVRRWI